MKTEQEIKKQAERVIELVGEIYTQDKAGGCHDHQVILSSIACCLQWCLEEEIGPLFEKYLNEAEEAVRSHSNILEVSE